METTGTPHGFIDFGFGTIFRPRHHFKPSLSSQQTHCQTGSACRAGSYMPRPELVIRTGLEPQLRGQWTQAPPAGSLATLKLVFAPCPPRSRLLGDPLLSFPVA